MNIVSKVTIGQLDDLRVWSDEYGKIQTQSAGLIGQAIQEFRKFSGDYLNYFLGLLPPGVELTPVQDRLWTRALQAFNEYWTPLGEVAAQHMIEPYRIHLDKGTTIAQQYLDKLNIGLPGVVVYFNKANSIRFVPYSNVAFLAVPYTHIARKDEDWMAIPHEIGHYLYWNLADNLVDVRTKHSKIRDTVQAALEDLLTSPSRPVAERDAIVSMALNWIEECFADVVGVKLADTKFTASFGTLLSEVSGSVASLTENDGSHPPLCLRPFMREHVLQKLGMQGTGINWPKLMQDAFGVTDFDELTLRAQPLEVEDLFRSQSLNDLIALLGGMEDTVGSKIYPITWKIKDAIDAVNRMADLLIDITPDVTGSVRSRKTDKGSAFNGLLELAQNEALIRGMEPDEVLLMPVVLEGGDRHSHSAYGHWVSHSVGAHGH